VVDARDRERPMIGEALTDHAARRRVGQLDRFSDPHAGQVGINRPEAQRTAAGGSNLSFEIRLIKDTCEAEMLGDTAKPAVHEHRQHVRGPLHWLGLEEEALSVAR